VQNKRVIPRVPYWLMAAHDDTFLGAGTLRDVNDEVKAWGLALCIPPRQLG